MAENLSSEAATKMLDHLTGIAAYTVTLPLRLALLAAAPEDEVLPAEVVGGGYARQTVTFQPAFLGTAGNSNRVTFNPPPGPLAGFAIYDSSAQPKLIWQGAMSAPRTIEDGDTFAVEPGALVLALD